MKKSTVFMIVNWLAVIPFLFIEPLLIGLLGDAGSSVIMGIIFSLLIFCWFLSDAEDMNYEPSRLLKIAVIFISFISIPYYLIRVKGFGRALLSFLKFFGLLVTTIIICGAIAYFMPSLFQTV